ncbi:hypothetical protein HZA96_02720 [Candidatus Woesearchaeota archaeon]|nr:hypothetical protein [Candidatus Woesearchaeota archaeon]
MQQSLIHFPQKVQQQLIFIEKEYNNREDSWNIRKKIKIYKLCLRRLAMVCSCVI